MAHVQLIGGVPMTVVPVFRVYVAERGCLVPVQAPPFETIEEACRYGEVIALALPEHEYFVRPCLTLAN